MSDSKHIARRLTAALVDSLPNGKHLKVMIEESKEYTLKVDQYSVEISIDLGDGCYHEFNCEFSELDGASRSGRGSGTLNPARQSEKAGESN